MPGETIAASPDLASRLERGRKELRELSPRLFQHLGPPVPWNRTTYIGFLALVALWAARMYLTWATWGDLTIDSGHEMYLPAVLLKGKVLYRDIWYEFTPGAPYFNSYLFRLFGIRLEVLYWAGSLSALGSALLLYVAGMRLSSWMAGWTAGAILVIQAFQPGIFNFPLPYGFAAVYGCLTACLCVWLVTRASVSKSSRWTLILGFTAAAALLLKPEFGVASYVTLMLLMAIRGLTYRSWSVLLKDGLAVLPGAVICAVVILWMVSIRGFAFITQENIQSWPTSYFMQHYSKAWLDATGFSINLIGIASATLRTILFAAVVCGFRGILLRMQVSDRSLFLRGAMFLAVLAVVVSFLPNRARMVFRWICFPQDMVLYVGLAGLVAWFHLLSQRLFSRNAAVPLVLTFASLLAFRILFGMASSGYPIYYNGPVILSFLLLAPCVVPRSRRPLVFQVQMLMCFSFLTWVTLHASLLSRRPELAPLTTERGTILVPKRQAEAYEAAIAFMKEKAAIGESVLSIPEDTSLYFLSGTYCPLRVYFFLPGIVAPGKMTDEVIGEMERSRVRYLLWSNRVFPEYGAAVFGTDFDRPLGNYLRSHYRFVRPLAPDRGTGWDWSAAIWERKP